jgi:hypothetical protein
MSEQTGKEERSEERRRTDKVKATGKVVEFVRTEKSFDPEGMIKNSNLNDELKRECLIILKELKENKRNKGEEITEEEVESLIKIKQTITQNTQGGETRDAFESLNTLISNPNFNSQLLLTIHTIAQNTQEEATYGAFESLNSLISNPNFTPQLLPTIHTIAQNTKDLATGWAFNALKDKIKQSTIKGGIILLSSIIRTRFKNLKDEELVEAIKNIDISKYNILVQEISLLPDQEFEALLNAVNSCDVSGLRKAFMG